MTTTAVIGVSGTGRPGSWHAGHGDRVDATGWTTALCNRRLNISVEFMTGRRPLWATTDLSPVFAEDNYTQMAAAPDCLRCQRVLVAHPDLAFSTPEEV